MVLSVFTVRTNNTTRVTQDVLAHATQDVLAHATQDVVGCYSIAHDRQHCAAGTSAYQTRIILLSNIH